MLLRFFFGECSAISGELISRKAEGLLLSTSPLSSQCLFFLHLQSPPSLLPSFPPSLPLSYSLPFLPPFFSPFFPPSIFPSCFLNASFWPEPRNVCHRIWKTDLVASPAPSSHECCHPELPKVLSHFALLPWWPLSAQMNLGVNSGPQSGGHGSRAVGGRLPAQPSHSWEEVAPLFKRQNGRGGIEYLFSRPAR